MNAYSPGELIQLEYLRVPAALTDLVQETRACGKEGCKRECNPACQCGALTELLMRSGKTYRILPRRAQHLTLLRQGGNGEPGELHWREGRWVDGGTLVCLERETRDMLLDGKRVAAVKFWLQDNHKGGFLLLSAIRQWDPLP